MLEVVAQLELVRPLADDVAVYYERGAALCDGLLVGGLEQGVANALAAPFFVYYQADDFLCIIE